MRQEINFIPAERTCMYHALEKLRQRCWEEAWSESYLELQMLLGADMWVPFPCSQLMASHIKVEE